MPNCEENDFDSAKIRRYAEASNLYLYGDNQARAAKSRSLTNSSMRLPARVAGVKLETHQRVRAVKTSVFAALVDTPQSADWQLSVAE